MFELLTKLSFSRGMNFLLIIFGCLIGPFSFIYRYYYPLYQNNDLSKVLVLSVAIGAPVSLSMTVLNSLFFGSPKIKDAKLKIEAQLMLMGLTSGFSGFIFYSACIAHYFIPGISARDGIELMLYAFGGAISFSIFYAIRSKHSKGKKSDL